MSTILKNTFASLAVLFFFSCGVKKESSTKKENNTTKNSVGASVQKIKTDEAINHFYAALAGMDSVYKKDSSANIHWRRMRKEILDPLSTWKFKELPSECVHTSTLFYPFSGPDFVYANEIFSNVNKLVMFGLEDPGHDISHRGAAYAQSVLPKMNTVLRDYFGKGYFITGNMSNDLKSDSIRGVTPLLSTFIVKSGYQILSIDNFYLDSITGNKIKTTFDKIPASAIKGVQIDYTKTGAEICTLDYLSFNAEDPAINKHEELKKYFEVSIPDQTCTYFKSASYLMHYEGFSYIRNLCLRKSKYILEDDTGIPYKYFKSNWSFKAWGVYDKPISNFSGVFQSDLDSFYRSTKGISTIPFSMGYHYINDRQNLMFAEKKD